MLVDDKLAEGDTVLPATALTVAVAVINAGNGPSPNKCEP